MRPLHLVLLAVAALLHPLWTGGQTYRRDAWKFLLGCREYVGERLRAGELPEWFPYDALGLPFLGQAVGAVFHPTTWLVLLLPSELVLNFQVILGVVLAVFGTWLLAREAGANETGAALAAAGYGFSGYVISLTANVVFLWGAATLPLQLALMIRAARRGWTPALVLAVAACFVSDLFVGDIQGAYVFSVVAGLAAVPFVRRGRVVRFLSGAALAASVGIGLGAAQLLPSVMLRHQTWRATGVPWEEASWWSLHPLRIPELFLPALNVVGHPGRTTELFENRPGMWVWAEALGGSAVLTILAFSTLARRRIPPRVRWALGGLAALGLLASLGRHTPVYLLAYRFVPGLSSFRWPEKLVPIFLTGWCALAALGWTHRAPGWERRLFRWVALFAGTAVAVLVGTLAVSTPILRDYLLDVAASLSVGVAALLVILAITLRPGPWTTLGVSAVVLAELGLGSAKVFDARPLADSAAPPSTVPILLEAGAGYGRFRVGNLSPEVEDLDEGGFAGPAERRSADRDRAALVAAAGARYGIETAQTYMQGYPSELFEVMRSGALWFERIAPKLNVGFLLVSPHLSDSLERQGVPVYIRGPEGVAVVPTFDPWPRVYLATGEKRPEGPLDAALAALPRGRVLLETAGPPGPPGPPATGSARLLEYRPEFVRIAVSGPQDSVLVLNDLHSAGWSASLDGSPAPILLANGLVRAVRVPRGDHVVEMTFETPGFEAGLVISGVAAAVLLVGLVLGRLRRQIRVK